ncbi:MAG: hypothetical protein J5569_00805 [Oscillospiraceae bacterium]|nr:hypothetical protein [Oscillospiraceae bacterium]
MKIHVDSAAADDFFEGTCVKKQEGRDGRDAKQGSVIRLFPAEEEETEQYSERAERRYRLAGRCLTGAFLGCFLGAVVIDRFLTLSIILLVPSAVALVYGLWYELAGCRKD